MLINIPCDGNPASVGFKTPEGETRFIRGGPIEIAHELGVLVRTKIIPEEIAGKLICELTGTISQALGNALIREFNTALLLQENGPCPPQPETI
jgi:hypothetical protein